MSSQTSYDTHHWVVIDRGKLDICTSSSFGGIKTDTDRIALYILDSLFKDQLSFSFESPLPRLALSFEAHSHEHEGNHLGFPKSIALCDMMLNYTRGCKNVKLHLNAFVITLKCHVNQTGHHTPLNTSYIQSQSLCMTNQCQEVLSSIPALRSRSITDCDPFLYSCSPNHTS